MRKLIDYQGFTPPPPSSMSRWVVVCAAALLLAGCAKELAVEGPQSSSGPQLKTRAALPPVEPRKWAVEGAVYDEAMDVWMAPKPEVEAQIQAQAGAPTHLALKIYPKTEAEQWEIESDEDVQVSYIPFGFGQLTEQERALVEQSRAKMQSPQIEVSPYTVTYTDMVSTDGGPTSPVTIQLPILYVVWPVSKPLPATIEYQVEREIVQPRQTRAETYSFTCYLKVYDDVVKRNIPLTNMKVQYTVIETGQWYSAVTASDGSFRMNTGIPISEMNNYDWISRPCTLTSTDSRWKIVGSSNTTTPYLVELMITIPVGRNALYYPNPNDVIVPGDYYNRQVNEIHRAVNYFYSRNGGGDFPKPTLSGGIRIIAEDGPKPGSPTIGGNFDYGRSGRDPWITIYNNGMGSGHVVGAVLHELGHFTHYSVHPSNNHAGFDQAIPLIKESFASYVGWYICEEYYRGLGWVKPVTYLDMTGNDWQYWTKISGSEYSPLFVDLTDTYNQRLSTNSSYPNDEIQYVPSYAVMNIVRYGGSWDECANLIRQVVVPDYASNAQLEEYFADYEYFFTH